TIGIFNPLESYGGSVPTMVNQVELAKRAEEAGFAALWFRDVPLHVPAFGDAGQIYDPFVYMGYIAAHTSKMAGTCRGTSLNHKAEKPASSARLANSTWFAIVGTLPPYDSRGLKIPIVSLSS
ncbi:MAG: LLM class flavin-dependent oxidoreductase, partial [Sphingobacteriales bacterium]